MVTQTMFGEKKPSMAKKKKKKNVYFWEKGNIIFDSGEQGNNKDKNNFREN